MVTGLPAMAVAHWIMLKGGERTSSMPRRSATPKRASTLKMHLEACLYGVRSSPFTSTRLGTCCFASAN